MEISDIVFVYQMNDAPRMTWHGRSHFHQKPEYECHYFISGDGSFKNGSAVWPIRSGDIHFSAPEVVHQIRPAITGTPITYYAVLLRATSPGGQPEAREAEMLDRLCRHSGGPWHLGTSHRFFFADLLERHFSDRDDLKHAALYQYISLLYSIAGGNPSGAHTSDNVHVEKALAIFHRSISADLLLDDVAGRLGLTKEHFTRLFTKAMGMPPMKYFRRLKIEAACAMLASTRLMIGEISDRLSFRDQFAFTRTFRDVMHQTPTAYRKHCLQVVDFAGDVPTD